MRFRATRTSPYHDWTVEQLSKLNTRHLISLMKSSRIMNTCSCWPVYHCGDEMLSEDERKYNQRQWELGIRCKIVLKDRPHLDRNTKSRTERNFGGREKKVMRYHK